MFLLRNYSYSNAVKDLESKVYFMLYPNKTGT